MRYVLPFIFWGIPLILYALIPLILALVEIPFLRRVRNWSTGKGWTDCTHHGRRIALGMYGAEGCVECGATWGDPGKSEHTKADMERMWQSMQEYHAQKGARPPKELTYPA